MITAGKARKAMNAVAWSTPVARRGKTEKKRPATAARNAPIAQASENTRPTFDPLRPRRLLVEGGRPHRDPGPGSEEQRDRDQQEMVTTIWMTSDQAMMTQPRSTTLSPHGAPIGRDWVPMKSLVMVRTTMSIPKRHDGNGEQRLPHHRPEEDAFQEHAEQGGRRQRPVRTLAVHCAHSGRKVR